MPVSRALVVILLFAACSGGAELFLPGDGEPARIAYVGKDLSGRVGEPLSDSLVFEVSDAQLRPVGGARVVFELTTAGPGADVVPDTAETDSNGRVYTRMVLGTTIGAQVGQARVLLPEGIRAPSTDFQVTALPENANEMAAFLGDNQSGPVGAPLPQPLVVKVKDAFGNPVPGISISWSAEGGGSVSEPTSVTDGEGNAAVQRTLGPTAGPQATVATSEGLVGSPVTFAHTATAGNASTLSLISGNNQTAQVGTRLPADLVVRLVDQAGNGVPEAAVTWVVSTGGGSVTPENGQTDGAGYASAQYTLGAAPGANRVDAVVSGVGVVNFTATGTAAVPAALAVVVQPASSARNGQPLSRQPVIQVRDQTGGNAATPGITVTAQLSGGGGELLGTRQRVTDASGRATFTDLAITGGEGTRVLVFTAPGFAGATSNPIEVSAAPTTTTIVSDSPDPSTAGTVVTVGFRVEASGVVPTGSVTVTDGNQSCTGTLSGGSGSCQLALSTVGQRTLRATYSGASGLNESSDTEQHVVLSGQPPAPTATTTTITSDNPDPSAQGAPVTVSVTVSAGSGTPSGTVRVSDPNGGSCTIAAPSGSCTLVPGGTGSRNLTATYEGNASFAGSSDPEEHTVNAAPPQNSTPNADYNWTCEGLTCRFTNASSDRDGDPLTFRWDFGDGSAGSTEATPTHTFPAPGRYEVSLTATDAHGASDVSTAGVPVEREETETRITEFSPDDAIVGQPVRVAFEVRADAGTPTGSVTVSADGPGESCTGTVADGFCNLTFTEPGERDVRASFSGDHNFEPSSSEEEEIDVEPAPQPNQPPSATFSATCDGLSCSFDGTASNDPDGTITSWSWDFGDGIREGGPNTSSHTYSAENTYTVTLTVTDDDGASATATQPVSVTAPNDPPTAQIGSIICTGMHCEYTDGSTDPQGAQTIAEWSWVFGDESVPDGRKDPSHDYATAGTYTVTLSVRDNRGAASPVADQETITLPAPESAGLIAKRPPS